MSEAKGLEVVLADAKKWHAEQYKLVSLGAAVNDTQRRVMEEELAKAEANVAEIDAMQDESDQGDWLRAKTVARKRRDALRAELEQSDVSRGWHGMSPGVVAGLLEARPERVNSFVTAMGLWVARAFGRGSRVPARDRLSFVARNIDGSYSAPDLRAAAVALNERTEVLGVGWVICEPA